MAREWVAVLPGPPCPPSPLCARQWGDPVETETQDSLWLLVLEQRRGSEWHFDPVRPVRPVRSCTSTAETQLSTETVLPGPPRPPRPLMHALGGSAGRRPRSHFDWIRC